MVQILLESGIDPNMVNKSQETPLHLSRPGRQCQDIIQLLLDYGADPIKQCHRGSTRLYRAASEGEINIAKLLLDRGADLKTTFSYGESLLHAAAMSGNLEMVQLLLDIGADPNKTRIDGMTPLHKAVNNEHIGTVILLLDRGADPDIKIEGEGHQDLKLIRKAYSSRL